ncbi:MAG: proline iminopeptidase-family hydrolase [Daejeonella sp.]
MQIKKLTSFLLLLVSTTLFAQTQETKDSVYYAKLAQGGTKMISVQNGKYKVFTQKIGKGKIKLLLLHGGPANGHEYFENFPKYLKKQGITIYYYEQLGSYYSESPLDSTAYTPNAFVEHVEEVRKALNLKNFYLLGHSWGGMLAELYAQKYQKNLKGLILSNVPGWDFSSQKDAKIFSDSLTKLVFNTAAEDLSLKQYQPEVLDSVLSGKNLSNKTLSKTIMRQYNKILDSTMTRHTYYYKEGALPEPLRRDEAHSKANTKNNPYLKKLQLSHRKVDYKPALLSIKTNTLLLGSAHDYMYAQGYYDMKKAMTNANVRVEIVPDGSHFAMWDDPEHYFEVLTKFIKDVEKKRFKD